MHQHKDVLRIGGVRVKYVRESATADFPSSFCPFSFFIFLCFFPFFNFLSLSGANKKTGRKKKAMVAFPLKKDQGAGFLFPLLFIIICSRLVMLFLSLSLSFCVREDWLLFVHAYMCLQAE